MFVDNFENQSKEKSESIKKRWLETATKFLKGKPYQDLEWEFSEDISIEPYYTKDEENHSDLSYLQILQNNQLALNEPVSQPRFWYNQPFIKLHSLEKEELEKINKEVRQVLMSGAEGVCFDLKSIELADIDKKKIEYLLFEVALPYCAVSFQVDIENENELQSFLEKYIDYVKERGFEIHLLTGGVLYQNSSKKNNQFSTTFLESVSQTNTAFRSITLQLNNSKDEAQNIADILFEVKKLVENSNKNILQNIQFVVEATDSFFITIAKIRALNWLLIQMYDLYQVDTKPYIHSITSQGTDEKSLEDENWNLIRNTTQAFSCILGGTNALSVVSHQNQENTKSKAWANRIARNVSVMLREESFVDATADPISGSYYCEQMTDKLIASAWKKFQEMIN
ncbi:methylmalonyl-CoA mutase family protein [Bernardetia sp. MNP-M8]|uniref:methylmalonyl-CoA mutase family protein n=1 Tax=Bernardetia sp. MNP-M8 TaxID=3127470 RepID=UPI0030CD5B15